MKTKTYSSQCLLLIIVPVCIVIILTWKWRSLHTGVSVQNPSTLITPIQDGASLARTSVEARGSRCQGSAMGWPWSEMESSHKDVHEKQQGYWSTVSRNYMGKDQAADISAEKFKNFTSEMIGGLRPTYTCPLHRRYGGIPDGGKTLCDPHCTLARPRCLIYSFGVGWKCGFEHQLWRQHPNCEIHLFDPTPGLERLDYLFFWKNPCVLPKRDGRLTFHPWGLGGFQNSVDIEGKKVELLALPEVMRRLGHEGRTLDILKVDVEGSEYDAFKYLFDKKELPAINMLLLEGHMGVKLASKPIVRSFLSTMKQLEAASFRLYHLERNPYGSWADFEAAFVNKTMLPLLYQ